MGDISTEPSMEEILSSIKRIIAEEGDVTPGRPRRPGRVTPAPVPPVVDDDEDEVLELSDPIPADPPTRRGVSQPAGRNTVTPVPAAQHEPEQQPMPASPDPILSAQTAEASRGSLDALSRLMVKPDPSSDGTLEGLVRDMLRPMLGEWLDSNLPAMVESMVSREIARITRQGQ